jgi:hypothetical protein
VLCRLCPCRELLGVKGLLDRAATWVMDTGYRFGISSLQLRTFLHNIIIFKRLYHENFDWKKLRYSEQPISVN